MYRLVSEPHTKGELITTFNEGPLKREYLATSARSVSAYGMGEADVDGTSTASSSLGCYMQGAGFCVARVVPENVWVGIRNSAEG